MAFGREFSKYLPGIAETLSTGILERKQKQRYGKLIAPLGGSPEEAAAAVRTPEYQETAASAGMSPEDVLSLYRQLPVEQQQEAERLLNDLEVRYLNREQLAPQEMEMLYDFGKLKRPERPDPMKEAETELLKDPDVARRAALKKHGLLPPEKTPVDMATDEALRDPAVAKRVAFINLGLEPKAAQPKTDDLTTPQRVNEIQQTWENRRRAAADKLSKFTSAGYEFKTKAAYKVLEPSEQETFQYDADRDNYYRERPEVRKELDEADAYLGDLGAQFKSADSLAAARAPQPPQPPAAPTEPAAFGPQPEVDPNNLPVETLQTLPPEALTPEQMAKILQAQGYEDATPDHPQIEEAYRNWYEKSAVDR
jgi:hypothetical protein